MPALHKQTVRDVDVRGKRVFVRVDFNLPQDASGQISDDSRMREALPTLHYLFERQAKVILCSHLGRPKGVDPKLSLVPMAKRLGELLKRPVPLAADSVGPAVEQQAKALREGQVLMLENVRFHPEEEQNAPAFAKALAALAEVYVNDAFGTAHRAHASTEGIAHHLPAVAGLLMERELNYLAAAVDNPRRPMTAIFGGAKVSDKVKVLEAMVDKADSLLVGGGMCATFFKAKGYEVGNSLVEDGMLDTAKRLEEAAKRKGKRLLLPTDVVIGDKFDANAAARTVSVTAVPPGWLILDIGPQTIAAFTAEVAKSKTVIWNGPQGVFEFPRFAIGTKALAGALTELDATTIVGGGSTAEAVHSLGIADRLTHVSTGGGASLELLEGRTLPGVAALLDK